MLLANQQFRQRKLIQSNSRQESTAKTHFKQKIIIMTCTPSGGVPGMSRWEETPRKTQDTLEWLCRPAGLGTPWDPPGRAGGSVRREGSLGVPAQAAAPVTWSDKRMKMDGWTCTKISWPQNHNVIFVFKIPKFIQRGPRFNYNSFEDFHKSLWETDAPCHTHSTVTHIYSYIDIHISKYI